VKRAAPLALMAAFVTSLSVSLSGCLFPTNCECSEIPSRPASQQLKSLLLLFEGTSPRVARPPGSVVVSQSEVVIDYELDGATVHVVYDVFSR